MTWVMVLLINHGGSVLPGYETKERCEAAAKLLIETAKKDGKEKGWYFSINLVSCSPGGPPR